MYCYVHPRSDGREELAVEHKTNPPGLEMPPQTGAPVEKLIHLALPVRLTHTQNGERSGVQEMSCTYDIHPRGARLLSFRDVKVGDLITVERGRSKSMCQVVWTADPQSALRGQFTVECVEGRVPWEEELRQMQEQYLPILAGGQGKKPVMNAVRIGEQNRRRGPRFKVEGEADLAQMNGSGRVGGRVEQLSELGCLISASNLLVAGTDLRLALNIYDVSVALKGNVKYTAGNRAMGVEFHEIRQGDRPLLDYVLSRVKNRGAADFSNLEVITEAAAVAG
jgi:hypothetical protein